MSRQPGGARARTVTRKGPVTYVEGLPVRPASTTFEILASVQPLSGADLKRAPEGLRRARALKGYTTSLTPLRTVAADGPEADLLTVEGVVYEIYHVDTHGDGAPQPHQRLWLQAAEGTEGVGT